MKKYELKDAALKFGFNQNTFIVMKSAYPEKFKYIRSFNKRDFFVAYSEYIADMHMVFEDSKIMYLDLKDKRLVADFGRLLEKKGIYSGASFRNAIKQALYSSENGISYHDTYLKFKRILKLYPKYSKSVS